MLDNNYNEKSKWFGFNGSIVNFEHVMKVYIRIEKPAVIIEFYSQPQANSIYEFHSLEDAEAALTKIFKFLSD